jgi:hypothetical protein
VVPTVSSLYPLWDEKANTITPPPLPHYDEHAIHMPSPSYWPLVLAFAVTMLAGGLLIWDANHVLGYVVMSAMGALGLRAVYGWIFEPVAAEEAHTPVHH